MNSIYSWNCPAFHLLIELLPCLVWQSLCVWGCFKILDACKSITIIWGYFDIEYCYWYHVIGRTGKTNMIFLWTLIPHLRFIYIYIFFHVSFNSKSICCQVVFNTQNPEWQFRFLFYYTYLYHKFISASDPWESFDRLQFSTLSCIRMFCRYFVSTSKIFFLIVLLGDCKPVYLLNPL